MAANIAAQMMSGRRATSGSKRVMAIKESPNNVAEDQKVVPPGKWFKWRNRA